MGHAEKGVLEFAEHMSGLRNEAAPYRAEFDFACRALEKPETHSLLQLFDPGRESAGCEICSACAAARKLPRSATATKARISERSKFMRGSYQSASSLQFTTRHVLPMIHRQAPSDRVFARQRHETSPS